LANDDCVYDVVISRAVPAAAAAAATAGLLPGSKDCPTGSFVRRSLQINIRARYIKLCGYYGRLVFLNMVYRYVCI